MRAIKIKSVTNILSSFVCLALACPVLAEVQQSDISEALMPFPRSEVVDQRSGQVEDYSIALAQMKKVRDIWGPERERRLAGELQRQTMRIPDGHSAQEAFDFYRRKMRNFNARILYECEARSCGSSNAWANAQFEDKTLYGLDDQQTYGAYEIVDERGFLNYVALYTVTRGNRRVYAHTEWLRTDDEVDAAVAPSAEEVTNYLQDQGYYIVTGINLDAGKITIDDEHLQAMVGAIRANRRMNIHIVGHSYSGDTLEQQQQQSGDYAKQVFDLLVGAGVSNQRLSYHGLGSLAPAGQAAGNRDREMRIELVASR